MIILTPPRFIGFLPIQYTLFGQAFKPKAITRIRNQEIIARFFTLRKTILFRLYAILPVHYFVFFGFSFFISFLKSS